MSSVAARYPLGTGALLKVGSGGLDGEVDWPKSGAAVARRSSLVDEGALLGGACEGPSGLLSFEDPASRLGGIGGGGPTKMKGASKQEQK